MTRSLFKYVDVCRNEILIFQSSHILILRVQKTAEWFRKKPIFKEKILHAEFPSTYLRLNGNETLLLFQKRFENSDPCK